MALLTPQVTKLTVAATDHTTGAKTVAALYAHYNAGTSTKFDLVANGHAATGFTITPKGSDTWHLNIRPDDENASAHVSLDPKAGITAPGDATTAPTVASDTEWTAEYSIPGLRWWSDPNDRVGTVHDDFYLIEVADCIIILLMDTAKTCTPWGTLAGRVFVPWFTDGVNGDDYCDGLGILGGAITSGNNNYSMFRHSTNHAGTRLRMHREYVSNPGDQWWLNYWWTNINYTYSVNGKEKLNPFMNISAYTTVGGTHHKDAGYPKYCLRPKTGRTPGNVLDGGPGQDSWVHVWNGTWSGGNLLVPWDRNLLPDFG